VVIVDGLQGPHRVVAPTNGTLIVTEHLAGRILEVRP